MTGEGGIWVFGYGSLMWRPGFPHNERLHAVLTGAHRALCVYSHIHRGTKSRPGLVLGLDAGGWCEGIAFRVPAPHVRLTLQYLRRREQTNNVYRAMWRTVSVEEGARREVRALCYVVNRTHRQYAGDLPLDIQHWLVWRSSGRSGRNIDYVINTARQLRECGIKDPRLEALVARLPRSHQLPGVIM